MPGNTLMVTTVIIVISILMVLGILHKRGVPIIQTIGRLMARLLIAAVGLYLLNLFGSLIAFRLAINPVTVAVAGILGIPGVISLIMIKYFVLQ